MQNRPDAGDGSYALCWMPAGLMGYSFPITLDAPITGFVALLVLVGLIAVSAMRRPALPVAALVLIGGGALLLVLAAGGAAWRAPRARSVAVLVDLSPSTRTAGYREPARLEQRIRELLGGTPYEIQWFAEDLSAASPTRAAGPLADLPATRTVLPAMDAPAVLLFSDGRFTVPAGTMPPTYAVIDGALDDTQDAAVTGLDVRGGAVAVAVRNGGPECLLALQGFAGASTVPVRPGAYSLIRQPLPGASSLSASFAPGDAWPENDSLRAPSPPAAERQRWWVGDSDPGAGWTRFSPGDLPPDPAPFLAAAVIVLDNVPAGAFDESRRAALRRYVEELGGGVLILGGDRAFAAGGYAGTMLDAVSPLASTPPEPATHWLLLADASGSMNQAAPGGASGAARTRWHYAADAVTGLIPQLPPADLLSVGSFARDLRWWSQGRPVEETRLLALPPADIRPRGPTNLDAVLREIAARPDDGMPRHLLLATDGNAEIEGPADLARQLGSKQVRLHVLLIGDPGARGLPALESIAAATGGSLRVEQLPENWAEGLRELMRAARPVALQRELVEVAFTGEAQEVGAVTTEVWNRTWPREGVERLAEASLGGERLTMAARWNVGAGQVAAVAFAIAPAQADRLADLVSRPPRDPRFEVSWDTGGALRVTVDAADRGQYLNGEAITLETRLVGGGGRPTTHAVAQSAPGRYELQIEAPRQPLIATVRIGSRILDAIAVAGRYAPEFDAIGNDRAALVELARRSGGAVIEPGVTRPLDLAPPRRAVPLVSSLAMAGALLVAAGLVRWRVGS